MKLCSQMHIMNQVEHLRWSFLTSVKPYFINILNLIDHFLHNSPFHEKTYNCENFGRKSLVLTIEQFFFWNSKLHSGMVSSQKKWHGRIKKIFWIIICWKCLTCSCLYCFLFSFIQILWSKHYFKNNSILLNSQSWKKRINYLKHEIILYQKDKKRKIFQVKP